MFLHVLIDKTKPQDELVVFRVYSFKQKSLSRADKNDNFWWQGINFLAEKEDRLAFDVYLTRRDLFKIYHWYIGITLYKIHNCIIYAISIEVGKF